MHKHTLRDAATDLLAAHSISICGVKTDTSRTHHPVARAAIRKHNKKRRTVGGGGDGVHRFISVSNTIRIGRDSTSLLASSR